MKPALKKRLLDALEACRAIQGFVTGQTFADYERNLMLRSAVHAHVPSLAQQLEQLLASD